MEEVPDGRYMRLSSTAFGQALVHIGTGEWQLLEGHAELSIVDGEGVLKGSNASGESEVDWVANRLTKALIRASPDEGGELCDFIFDTRSKTKTRWDIEFDKGLSTVAQRLQAGSSEGFLDAFVSALPRRERFVRWGLSRLVCHLRGNTHVGRWLAKSAPLFRKFFETMRYDSGLLFDSRNSVVDTCYSNDKSLDLPAWSAADPDWSVSNEGFLLICCYFMTSGEIGGVDQSVIVERAIAMLQAWVEGYMRQCPPGDVQGAR